MAGARGSYPLRQPRQLQELLLVAEHHLQCLHAGCLVEADMADADMGRKAKLFCCP